MRHDPGKHQEETEELEAIRAYDAARAADDEAVPFEQAIREIERDRHGGARPPSP